MSPDPHDFRSRRLASTPRHSRTPGGRHRAVVMPGWLRLHLFAVVLVWWLGIA